MGRVQAKNGLDQAPFRHDKAGRQSFLRLASVYWRGPTRGVAITLSVDDVDAAYRRALDAGATGMAEPADQFHGDRTASLRCPFGHKWILQKHLRDVSPEEAQQLLTDMMSGA